MYPNEKCPWVPVALTNDLPSGTVMPAWTPKGPIALWRSRSGLLSAAADRCPHRGMRLSLGFVRGEALSCIYHGWSYGRDGRCRRIPAHPGLVPPETINTDNQVVAERNGIIWVTGVETDAPVPAFEGWTPLRSLTFAAPLEVMKARTGGTIDEKGLLVCTLGGVPVALLPVEQGNGNLLVHALVETATQTPVLIAASRGLEVLRRRAEETVARGDAA